MVDPRVDHFRMQAVACLELGSPLYAGLIGRLADALDSHSSQTVTSPELLEKVRVIRE